jgi:hypothetical protein
MCSLLFFIPHWLLSQLLQLLKLIKVCIDVYGPVHFVCYEPFLWKVGLELHVIVYEFGGLLWIETKFAWQI